MKCFNLQCQIHARQALIGNALVLLGVLAISLAKK